MSAVPIVEAEAIERGPLTLERVVVQDAWSRGRAPVEANPTVRIPYRIEQEVRLLGEAPRARRSLRRARAAIRPRSTRR